ncbi:hypothetical protein NU219Hw_g6442t1 [Hortaea werneckii]
MAKIKLSDHATLCFWIFNVACVLWIATNLILGFGFPDFTCAHVPALASYADNFLWLSFMNLGGSLSAEIFVSGLRYGELPAADQEQLLPGKEKEEEDEQDRIRERSGWTDHFGRGDRYALAALVLLWTLILGPLVRLATKGMAVDCTQWNAAANGIGVQ